MGLVMAAAARSRWPIRWLCLAGGLDAAWRGSRGGGPQGGRHSLWGGGVPKHGVGGQHLGNRVADVYHLGHSTVWCANVVQGVEPARSFPLSFEQEGEPILMYDGNMLIITRYCYCAHSRVLRLPRLPLTCISNV